MNHYPIINTYDDAVYSVYTGAEDTIPTGFSAYQLTVGKPVYLLYNKDKLPKSMIRKAERLLKLTEIAFTYNTLQHLSIDLFPTKNYHYSQDWLVEVVLPTTMEVAVVVVPTHVDDTGFSVIKGKGAYKFITLDPLSDTVVEKLRVLLTRYNQRLPMELTDDIEGIRFGLVSMTLDALLDGEQLQLPEEDHVRRIITPTVITTIIQALVSQHGVDRRVSIRCVEPNTGSGIKTPIRILLRSAVSVEGV